MRSLSSLGGKVRKKSGSELDSNRYSYISLDQAEPDFGIPDSDKSVLLSDADGSRLFGKFSNGLTINANGIITGDESTFEINTSGYSFSSGSTLAQVLQELDSNLALATAALLSTVQTDNTLNGAGTVANPLSVDSNNILNIIDLRVNKPFVDGLNVDADTLDSQNGSYYLDYTNFNNVPNILDSGNVIATITNAGFATQTFVNTSIDSAVAGLVNSSPEQLDTLSELAAALNNDSDFANNITALIGTKLAIADFTTYFNSNFDTRSTDSLSEGSTNLYYLTSRVDSDVTALVNADYINARVTFDSAFIEGLIDSAYISSIINVDSANITSGTIDNTIIGSVTPAAGTFTTVDTTNIEVTNIKAKDGTSAGSIADSTGVITLASSVLTTTDINGGTIDGVTIGGESAGAITGTTITGTSFVSSGDMDVSGDINLPDWAFGTSNKGRLLIGDSDDLQLYHISGNNYIKSTSPLQILTNSFQLNNGNNIEQMIFATADGSVDLFYNNAKKLETTATGIDVTGSVIIGSGDTVTLDGDEATVASTSQTSIAEFPHATYGGAKFIVTATQSSKRQITELLVTHNGTTAYATEYGTIATDSDLATFDVDISGTDVRLLATGTSATSTSYKVAETLIEA
jgi:hypothetical protein